MGLHRQMSEILKNKQLEYTGSGLKTVKRDEDGELLYPYLPSNELVEVVNLAIHLKRPLLLKGEPGCGKTKLARAVAYELGLNYEEWNIKSTSRAKDGLYTYDAVGRLRDAQLISTDRIPKEEFNKINQRFSNPSNYVKLGPLGKAITNQQDLRTDKAIIVIATSCCNPKPLETGNECISPARKQTVLLIDEIDKADIDFPNDLLVELDKFTFEIEETGDKFSAKSCPPIVFITSNDEKDLPDAFLRRCVFHYINFPKEEKLKQIIHAHFSHEQEKWGRMENWLDEIIKRFLKIRKEMDQRQSRKIVSTSELLDWVKAIIYQIDKDNDTNANNDNQQVSKPSKQPLHPGVLLKNWEDYEALKERVKLEEKL